MSAPTGIASAIGVSVGITIPTAFNPLPEGLNLFLPSPADLFWSAVMLLAIAIVFYKLVLPMVTRVLDQRTALIDEGLAQAEEVKAQADHALEQRQFVLEEAQGEAARTRDQARAEGEQIIANARKQATVEAGRITATATAQIAAAQQAAEVSLRQEVGDLAGRLATKIVGESLVTPEAKSKAVDAFLDELDAGVTQQQRAEAAQGHGHSDPERHGYPHSKDQVKPTKEEHRTAKATVHYETALDAAQAARASEEEVWPSASEEEVWIIGGGSTIEPVEGLEISTNQVGSTSEGQRLGTEKIILVGDAGGAEGTGDTGDLVDPTADAWANPDSYVGRLSAEHSTFEQENIGEQP